MSKKIDFKDFLSVDYAPGMPDLIKRNAKKRKSNETETSAVSEAVPPGGKPLPALTPDQAHKWLDQGKHAKKLSMGWKTKNVTVKQEPDTKGMQHHMHVHQYVESVEEDAELDEALTPQQRRLRALQMNRKRSRIKIGQKRARMRFADMDRLKRRAIKAARTLIFKKLTKGIPKDELTYQRRAEIEKRLNAPAMKKRIAQIAVKLLPKERRAEMERHLNRSSAEDK